MMGPLPGYPDERMGALIRKMSSVKFGPRDGIEKLPFYWEASHFGLDRVATFQEMNESAQEKTLTLLTQHYLSESSFIEKAGMSFNAKMILLSETFEEKALYSVFASDEVKHFFSIERYIAELPRDGYRENPFLAAIARAITHAEKDSLVLIIQRLLEGFGMSHYKWLEQGCRHPGFQAELTDLLHDEAYHHGSGVLLSQQPNFRPNPRDLEDHIPDTLQLLQGWIHPVLSALDAASGGISVHEKTEVLESLGYEAQTREKLTGMKRLLTTEQTTGFVSRLEERGLFREIPAAACAGLHQEMNSRAAGSAS
jgi:hypothetical protein